MKLLRRQGFKVENFEYLAVGSGLALLRLSGRWRSDAGSPSDVKLIATTRDHREQLATLPEPPPDESGAAVWRGAFSAPSALLEQRPAFSLETPAGLAASLPAPVKRDGSARPAPRPARRAGMRRAAGAKEARRRGGGDELKAERSARIAAERTLGEERVRAEQMEASLREQLDVTVKEAADFMGRLEGYEARRAELETELSWERLVHKETRRLGDDAQRASDEAMAGLEQAQAELERVRREAEGRAIALEKADGRLAKAAEETERQRLIRAEAESHARRELDRLEGEIEQGRGEIKRLEGELEQTRELDRQELEAERTQRARLEEELRSVREQVATFAAQALKLQDEAERLWHAQIQAESDGRGAAARLQRELDELRESAERQLAAEAARSGILEEELGAARERIADVERQLTERDGLLENARAGIESGSLELADLEQQVEKLREAASARVRADAAEAARRSGSTRRFPTRPELFEHLRLEADRGVVRLAALERRVTDLRDAIAPHAAGEMAVHTTQEELAVEDPSADRKRSRVGSASKRRKRSRFRRSR